MNKNNCKVGQRVTYFPTKVLEGMEFGVVTELRDVCAMVLYEGDKTSKATYYADLEPEPATLAPVGRKNENY